MPKTIINCRKRTDFEMADYTVRENPGEAYTIREYVTGLPLGPDELLPDEHGIYPVNPLGFFVGTDADGNPAPLKTAPATQFYISDRDTDAEGNLSTIDAQFIAQEAVTIDGPYTVFTGDAPGFPVESLVCDTETSPWTYTAVITGKIPGAYGIQFTNATSDDYEPTGILDSVQSGTMEFADGKTTFTFTTPSQINLEGPVGPGKLYATIVVSDKDYIYVSDTGEVYRFAVDGEPLGYFSLAGIYHFDALDPEDEVTVCHAANGYSDQQVMEAVEERTELISRSGKHPSSEVDDLAGAGVITRWFHDCGDVDLSGGKYGSSVMVPGFGLGAGFMGKCHRANEGETVPDMDEDIPHPLITFGYGTKRDATNPSTGTPALPLDWPFTDLSGAYDGDDINNSITLTREPMEVTGGTTRGGMLSDTGLRNRAHLCLVNDFTPDEDDTTCLKKTFVNLAAPITTKDGEEYELTVSLQNVGEDAFMNGDKKDLSGYYAYISQPRVYVMGGRWEFSNTRVSVTDVSGMVLTLDGPFEDGEGEDLADTDVRVKVKYGNGGRNSFAATGTLDSTGTTLTLAEGTVVPEEVKSGNPFICGAFYVPANNEETGFVSERLGLNGARDGNSILIPDKGDGGNDSLNVYNTFYNYAKDDDKDGRINLGEDSPFIATVYPTVTNTFGWSTVHRRKITVLDRLMTDEADCGAGSVFGLLTRVNKDLIEQAGWDSAKAGWAGFTPEQYPLDLAGYIDPVGRVSVLGTSIAVGGNGEVSEEAVSQPVRQALRAVAMLAEDARTVRYRHDKPEFYNNKFRKDASAVTSYENMFDDSTELTASNLNAAVLSLRLRHLPGVISQVESDQYGEPVSSAGVNAYKQAGMEYYRSNPYGYTGKFTTTDLVEENGCDFVNCGTERVYSQLSSVRALLDNDIEWVKTYGIMEDILRVAEAEYVPMTTEYYNPFLFHDSAAWTEPFDAFTKIMSVDGIPYPADEDYRSYETLSMEQTAFVSGDLYDYYSWFVTLGGGDLGNDKFIATTMPNSDGLPEGFLDYFTEYVPMKASGLPRRNWDGTRVGIDPSDTNGRIYKTRWEWYLDENGCLPEEMGKYATDTFYASSMQDDPNMNATVFPDMTAVMSRNYSASPYTVSRAIYSREPFTNSGDYYSRSNGAVSYVRVYMKFTFSADFGRWICTDYRQAPVSYLTPLYGHEALEAEIDGKRVWSSSTCELYTWKNVLSHKYSEYKPLDISPEVVPEVMSGGRLTKPWRAVDDTDSPGLGLYAPADKTGGKTAAGAETEDGIVHANFWSVRNHLRPATGVLTGTDVPATWYEGDTRMDADDNGIMSDPVLWGQFDYPVKGQIIYHLPSTEDPEADMSSIRLIYAKPNADTGEMDTGDILIGESGRKLAAAFGNEATPEE